MKIAIPLDEEKKEVCVSFARAPFFLFKDENGNTEIKENPAADAEGGAGLKASQFILDEGADTLITVRCGENAAKILKLGEVKIYKSEKVPALENIKLLEEGSLSPLTHFHAGFHGIQQ